MILLGPAGSPKGSSLAGVRYTAEIGLQAMECEFVYGVKMSKETAVEIGQAAKKVNVKLSVHAPYYINLASDDKKKLKASKEWLLQSCERAHYLNAGHVVFHPGFYGKKDHDETFEAVYAELKEVKKIVREHSWNTMLAPETTGKLSAFGSLDEVIRLAKKLRESLCIDFAHLYARNHGRIDYGDVLGKVSALNLKHIHSHFSSIEYTEKGERRHRDISENRPSFSDLAKELLKRRLNITIICESPRQYLDSLDMLKTLTRMGYRF